MFPSWLSVKYGNFTLKVSGSPASAVTTLNGAEPPFRWASVNITITASFQAPPVVSINISLSSVAVYFSTTPLVLSLLPKPGIPV